MNNNAAVLNVGRQQRLLAELQLACGSMRQEELRAIGGRALTTLGKVTVRRARNLLGVLKAIGEKISAETRQGYKSAISGEFDKYAKQLATRTSQASVDIYDRTKTSVTKVFDAVSNNPREHLPPLIIGALAAVAASGGVDGDGGVPDLDLTLGIGAHRSIFTHSILSGAVIETTLLTLADLIGSVHQYLPTDHDPLWDAIAKNKAQFIHAASTGASAGIAYHLMIDATVQPGTYHGLPFSMPQEAHNGLMGANAAAEGIDAATRPGVNQQADPMRAVSNAAAVVSDSAEKAFAHTKAYLSGAMIGFKVGFNEATRTKK